MTRFYNQLFSDHNEDYSLIIENDGRVAYVYLLKGNDIIGDVWLYNQADTSMEPTWSNSSNAPFLNPDEFVLEEISPILDSSDLEIEWSISDNLGINDVVIIIRGKAVAKLIPGSTPGWSTIVSKDGPLAKSWNRQQAI